MKKLVYTVEQLAFLHPVNLEDNDLKQEKFHYYFIVSTPIKYIKDIYVELDSFVFILSDSNEEFKVIIPHNKDEYTIKNFTWKYKLEYDKISALLSYVITFKDGSEKNIQNLEFSANDVYYAFEKNQKFKIEYIGQSYAKNGNRIAQERLVSHSTLQKILSDISVDRSKDIRLFLLGVDIACIDNDSLLGEDSPIINIVDVCDNISYDHINLFEAYLINLFKPQYNHNFVKGKVPFKRHISYKKVIDESYEDFSVIFSIQDCMRDYIFFTDSKSIEITDGIINAGFNNGIIDFKVLNISFNEANRAYKDYNYSFINIYNMI